MRRNRNRLGWLLGVGLLAPLALATTEATSTTQADLFVSLSDSPDPVRVGQEVTFTGRIGNDGPSSARDVVVKETVPSNFTVTSRPSNCTQSGRVITCRFGTLSSGARRNVNVRGRFNSTGTFETRLAITSSTPDRDTGDRSQTVRTTVQPKQQPVGEADLQVIKTQEGGDSAVPGAVITFKLVARNNGPDASTNSRLEDTLPAGFDVTKIEDGDLTCREIQPPADSPIVDCEVGPLADDQAKTVRISGTFSNSGTVPIMAMNTAKFFLDEGGARDPNTTNNTDSTMTTVAPAPIGTR